MLINKGFTQGDVVSLKLTNGDELIARFEEEANGVVKINRPLALTMSQGGLGMIPWMFLGSEDTVTLKKDHVFAMMLSKKDASDQYLTGTTGIALR
jgi:hypothetical protein